MVTGKKDGEGRKPKKLWVMFAFQTYCTNIILQSCLSFQDVIHFGQMSINGDVGASFGCNHPGLWTKSGARSRSGKSFSKFTMTYPMLLNNEGDDVP